MKALLLVNPGIEETAARELKELLHLTSNIHSSLLEFDATVEQLVFLAKHCQAARRILILCRELSEMSSSYFNPLLPWNYFISSGASVKVEIENISGQENRFSIAKVVMRELFESLKEHNITAVVDLKRPDVLIITFRCESKYLVGIDFCGKEINARTYRVFPHSASFKGDLAYAIIRSSDFSPRHKLLVGYVKDGALAIEAALFARKLSCRDPLQEHHSWIKFPIAQSLQNSSDAVVNTPPILAFDESKPNIIAAQKNSRLAKVQEHLSISHYSLDELDTRYGEEAFDRAIFHLTSKDEDKVNELYHQSKYILKQNARVLLLSRSEWKPPESRSFKLISDSTLPRGEGSIRLTLLEKR